MAIIKQHLRRRLLRHNMLNCPRHLLFNVGTKTLTQTIVVIIIIILFSLNRMSITTGEVGRHLLLVALRTDRRQVDRGNIGGEEPEEDGRWWIVR
jgi:hypothetical protein